MASDRDAVTWWLFVFSITSFAMDKTPTDCARRLDGSKLFLIVGPSGVGKTTLVKTMQSTYPDPLHFVVGVTTRAPRPGEVEGVDYYFWSEARYDDALRENHFVTTYQGPRARYGDLSSEFEPFLGKGIPVLCIVDLEGAAKIKARYPGSRVVRLATSGETVARRLAERNTESEAERRERSHVDRVYDGESSAVDVTLVNDDVMEASRELIRLLSASNSSPNR